MIDYDVLKALSQDIGRPVRDLIVLEPQNDPFYAGVPARRRDAEWFVEIWHQLEMPHGSHLRRVHYRIISRTKDGSPIIKPDRTPYLNTDNDAKFLDRASLAARYLNLISPESFIDRRNDEPMIFMWQPSGETACIHLEDLWTDAAYRLEDFPDLPGFDLRNYDERQEYLVEVWIEKSTENDWLVPLCRQHGVNLVVGAGEMSEVACRLLIERVEEARKPARVLYISDFDPAGRSMPVAVARKMEFYLTQREIDADITLNPIILTEQQCVDLHLPRTPIKDERRKDKFEERFGFGATELDALEAQHPGLGREIIEEEILRYFDPTLGARVRDARNKIFYRLHEIEREVLEPHQEKIDLLQEQYAEIHEELSNWESEADELWDVIAEDLQERTPDMSEFPPRPSARTAKEPEEPVLFDSKRDYLSQIKHYKNWQGRPG